MRAEGFNQDGANIILGCSLREELEQDKIVIAIGDDAGKVVRLSKDKTVRVVGTCDGSEFAAESECGFNAAAKLGEILFAGECGSARDDARRDHRCRRIKRSAERDVACIGDCDQRAGLDSVGWRRIEVGAINPEVAGAKTVCGAARYAERGHALTVYGA